jgi:negative regulator of sigma E activity
MSRDKRPNTDSRPGTDPLIRRIQPFIDGELAADEAAAVAAEIAEDPALKDMVDEQVSARDALRSLPPLAAPQALRARVLLELDAVDREDEFLQEEVQESPVGRLSRLRAFLRGGVVLVPAAAAAALLFGVTRMSASEEVAPQIAAASDEDMSLKTLKPQPIAGAQGAALAPADGVDLVSLGDLPRTDAAGLPEFVEYSDRRGRRIVELRQPLAGALPGTPQRFRGRIYFLGRDRRGRAFIAYDDGGLAHVLMPASPAESGDLRSLLELGDRLRSGDSR